MSILSTKWMLRTKAIIWRWMMKIGMTLHHRASPRPPSPSFVIKVPSRISSHQGTFEMFFYVPDEYRLVPTEQKFPVVVNYHGGGFTLGTGTDDARWAQFVIKTTKAVFVSVGYRLAPEYPFPVGIEDSADAVLYLAAHAEELRLDPHRMVLSGFSAGGNFALTVPFLLFDLQKNGGKHRLHADGRLPAPPRISNQKSRNSSATGLTLEPSTLATRLKLPLKSRQPTVLGVAYEVPSLTICCIASFYPPTDFRIPREDKRKTNPRQEMNLPPILTNLFDESYMAPPHTTIPCDTADIYISPAAASDNLLRATYPDSIILYTCEYDMLNAEGVAFGERLASDAVGKTVKGGLVKEVPHAFDKKPNPTRFSKIAEKCYSEACAELNVVFGRRESFRN